MAFGGRTAPGASGEAALSRPLRILFFGTPDFAVPTFERLAAGPHRIAAAVTQPERRRGRGRKRSPPPVAARAVARGIPVLQPEKVGAAESVAALDALEADLGVVVAFGQFLTRRVRELPRCGYLINAHASLLPQHRGAAPIAHALLAGDLETGVSVMRVEKEMDAGPVALVRRTAIRPDDNAGRLSERLAEIAAGAIADAADLVSEGRITWREQDHGAATEAPKIRSEDGRLDFSTPAVALRRRIQAFSPKPGAFTQWRGERLRILDAAVDDANVEVPPGTVTLRAGSTRVATAQGWLRLLRVQRAGAKVLEIDAFQRGHGLREGDRLDEERPS